MRTISQLPVIGYLWLWLNAFAAAADLVAAKTMRAPNCYQICSFALPHNSAPQLP